MNRHELVRLCRWLLSIPMLMLASGVPAQSPAGGSAVAGTDQPIFVQTARGRLSGSLLLPGGAGISGVNAPAGAPATAGSTGTTAASSATGIKPPVVLIVADSGPTDRDGNLAGAPGRSDCLKLLARALAAEGIASVRFDKRGVGASRLAGADAPSVRFGDLADDVVAWSALLKADARVGPLVVLGHGEGALLAMLAAQKQSPAALVSLAGPAGRASELMRAQLGSTLPDELRQRSDEILGDLELGQTVADVPPPLLMMFRPSAQAYLISWFRITPTEELARLKLPVLIVQGSHDLQIKPDNAALLKQARPDAQLATIEGMNHVLKTAPADGEGQRAAYLDPSLPVTPALVETIRGFVRSAAVR